MKKIKLYQVYPLISSCCFILSQVFLTNYNPREIQPVFQYLYLNVLFPVAYLFFIGYLIPLFLSIRVTKVIKRILVSSVSVFLLVYMIIYIYFFFNKHGVIFMNHGNLLLGILGGVLLGAASACYTEDNH
ncbi:hypothetical protein [Candidatus Enterococcus willemsii]|uniref:VanZ-like domain-containing protein n=1 Tax=Candidatus Enterococcus willemsii TaxID=1857215 RepID=A0ABQ6YWZ2_9ENTE|nr:hypothetical protein [Enterococcus sp. CU12B]KAF1302221.1 hypothetical protein BAU17_00795 [Enterococcus sp. CU12B]